MFCVLVVLLFVFGFVCVAEETRFLMVGFIVIGIVFFHFVCALVVSQGFGLVAKLFGIFGHTACLDSLSCVLIWRHRRAEEFDVKTIKP